MNDQTRLEQIYKNIAVELDNTNLRKIQAKTYRCAADCCENRTLKSRDVRFCIESCSINLIKVEQYVTKEFVSLQNRLQKCVNDCNEEVRSKFGFESSGSQINRDNEYLLKCTGKCVDKMANDVPMFLKNIKNFINSNQ